jgi:hypothetical protein
MFICFRQMRAVINGRQRLWTFVFLLAAHVFLIEIALPAKHFAEYQWWDDHHFKKRKKSAIFISISISTRVVSNSTSSPGTRQRMMISLKASAMTQVFSKVHNSDTVEVNCSEDSDTVEIVRDSFTNLQAFVRSMTHFRHRFSTSSLTDGHL